MECREVIALEPYFDIQPGVEESKYIPMPYSKATFGLSPVTS